MTIVEQVARARASGDWNAMIASVPYARFLGVTLEERDGCLIGRMKFADHLVGNPTLPALHGGTLGALLELAAQFELMYRAQTLMLPKTTIFPPMPRQVTAAEPVSPAVGSMT